ncbi:MAG TPA: class I SAM-dependent methyltransferase [Marinobacter sp.]|nr:class I SAM-dependent methyltransferase [Marinobacter sp.]
MAQLQTNTHSVLIRNAGLLAGPVAVLGVSEPALLVQCPEIRLAMSEHAGVYRQLAGHSQVDAVFGYECDERCAHTFATVVVFLPKARAELDLRLAMARYLAREGATLVLIGEKREGIAGAAKQFAAVAEKPFKVDSARHCQVWSGACHQPLVRFDLSDWQRWTRITCQGVDLEIAGLPGVFSEGELDAGTEMLLGTLVQTPLAAGRVLDFACGAGVIGSWLQLFRRSRGLDQGTVDGVDVQAQAVACARQTYARCGAEGQIHASDGLAGIEGRWPAVVTNPPFHSGVRTDTSMTEQFLREVAGHLAPKGELRLVANSFLPYESLIQRFIGPVEKLAQDRRFTVYRAIRR